MSRLHRFFLAVVCAVLVCGASSAFAQDQNGGGRRGNFDPAQFRERMMTRMKEQLGVNDDEWKVLQPKVEAVMAAQRESRGGGGFGGFGGRGGGGGADNQPTTALGQAQQALRQTLENKDAPADDIAKKLAAVREARENGRKKLQAAQKDLKEVLTQRQEAVLVMSGMLE